MKSKILQLTVLFSFIFLFTSCKKEIAPVAKCDSTSWQIDRSTAVQRANDFAAILRTIDSSGLQYKNAEGKEIKVKQATSVAFKLEDLKCFIEHIETYENRYKDLGMRAYFVAEPDAEGRLVTSVVFVPTGVDSKNGNSKLKSTTSTTSPDIPGASVLNHGTVGYPPYGNSLQVP